MEESDYRLEGLKNSRLQAEGNIKMGVCALRGAALIIVALIVWGIVGTLAYHFGPLRPERVSDFYTWPAGVSPGK